MREKKQSCRERILAPREPRASERTGIRQKSLKSEATRVHAKSVCFEAERKDETKRKGSRTTFTVCTRARERARERLRSLARREAETDLQRP